MFSLADAILQKDYNAVKQLLRYGQDVNEIDEYGFTPLIEAAIADDLEMSELLLNHGADPNQQDATGGTPLHWAVENQDIELCKLLIKHRANPNAYNFAGQPVMVMSILRHQSTLKNYLIKAGADLTFAQDYINTKLLGHLFELIGTAGIVSPDNKFVEVDFEGFYLEITLGLIADALSQFQNHFAARQLRRYSGLSQFIVEVMQRAAELAKYQQYRVDIHQKQKRIHQLLHEEPILIPVGYEGHAITFIKYGDIWAKCDRREDSRLFDNIMLYRIHNYKEMTNEFIKGLLYEKNSGEYINEDIDRILQLEPLTELKIEAQVSGNCSWANVEAAIPTIFFLVLIQLNKNVDNTAYYKTLALNYFHRFRDWNKERALHYCIRSFEESDSIRKTSKAEILAAILFQRCNSNDRSDKDRIESILSVLLKSPYEYIFQNYLRVYYYESNTPQGRRFAEMLRQHGYLRTPSR